MTADKDGDADGRTESESGGLTDDLHHLLPHLDWPNAVRLEMLAGGIALHETWGLAAALEEVLSVFSVQPAINVSELAPFDKRHFGTM